MAWSYDSERHRELVTTLVGEHERLYYGSASFRYKIDLLAQTLALMVEDAAVAATAENEDFQERVRQAERERTPMFLVKDGHVEATPFPCGCLVEEGSEHGSDCALGWGPPRAGG